MHVEMYKNMMHSNLLMHNLLKSMKSRSFDSQGVGKVAIQAARLRRNSALRRTYTCTQHALAIQLQPRCDGNDLNARKLQASSC